MEHVAAQQAKLTSALTDYRVHGRITTVHVGPTITTYEFLPERGSRHSRIISVAEDIARCLAVRSCRVTLIPNSSAVGIELPNTVREVVSMTELLTTDAWRNTTADLPLMLGKNMFGEPFIADLATMPHLLIAGTTGSGKSVGIHAILTSLLAKFGPDRCRLILIDPKQLEFKQYGSLPHLLAPVLTNPSDVIDVLHWVVSEMKRRYSVMSELSVRNIGAYNAHISDLLHAGRMLSTYRQVGFTEAGQAHTEWVDTIPEVMPYIVVVIDEVADLMMVAKQQVEGVVQRLAQMARAAGIHLVIATQRPSVDVVTGSIKANFPTRVSFRLQNKIDSRTIIGQQGAETLFGNGDLLFMDGAQLTRVQGAYVSPQDVDKLVDAHCAQQGVAFYDGLLRAMEV